MQTPAYALVRVDDGGWTWTRWFEPDADGGWTAGAVPAGRVELRRRDGPHEQLPERWPLLATLDVPVGGRARFDARHAR